MPLFTECQVIYQALFTDIQLLFPSAPREAGHHRAYTHIHTLGRKRNASLSSTTLCKIAVPLPDLALVCAPCPALCFSIRLPTTSWYIFVSCMSTIYEGKDFFFLSSFTAKALSPKTVYTTYSGLSELTESLPSIYKSGIKIPDVWTNFVMCHSCHAPLPRLKPPVRPSAFLDSLFSFWAKALRGV